MTRGLRRIIPLLILLAASSWVNEGLRSASRLRDDPSSRLPAGFRPPAVPLVVVDPYLSVWSYTDNLYDSSTAHWSGPPIALVGMLRIDGKPYRFMGNNAGTAEDNMQQMSVTVLPTQTMYVFVQDGVQLNLTFSTQTFTPEDPLIVFPQTYLTFDVMCIDGQAHSVQLYYDNTAEGTVDDTRHKVSWYRVNVTGRITMQIGSHDQNYLSEGTDRIDWGYWYISVPDSSTIQTSMSSSTDARSAFVRGDKLPEDDMNMPRPCSSNWPVQAVSWDLGRISPSISYTNYLQILYDQMNSIKYFGIPMAPLWKHYYADIAGLIQKTAYTSVIQACNSIDNMVTKSLSDVGGMNYTAVCSLAWRQAIAGTVSIWNDVANQPWMFLKEISSDGDVSTVDVLYPAFPQYLWGDPNVVKSLLFPLLEYANNGTIKYGQGQKYPLSWAPHHLGHWPVCDLPASKQEQMPVEESGNMLIMLAASVYKDKEHDVKFLSPYWDMLKTWADFIVTSLPDPGDQLCTDDFEGPSPHNINLAAKGIVGLGAMSYLLRLNGQSDLANQYDAKNKEFIQFWIANGSDGDHYKRQFNLPNSWSLKYNLLFQKILKLDLFPDSVFTAEQKFYATKMSKYGIPLDERHPYTKTDWLMWTAALGSSEQFSAITNAVYSFANSTPNRVPFTDWYNVNTSAQQGFRARPVIGGLFARMLLEEAAIH